MILQCELCPKRCAIGPGQSGDCRIRVNIDGKLHAVTYGYPSAVHIDPVEKKPLNHFLPGTAVLSLATVGCNLHCKFCQNWSLSQCNPEDAEAEELLPAALSALAARHACPSIAYTYSEPAVYYEYALDSSIKAHEAGLRNILVTAGYMNDAPCRELYRHTDAANIDLKAFSEEFYRDVCGGSLGPVLNTLVIAKSLGVHVEVTNLLVPTLNDGDPEITALCRWLKANLGRETPLHFSRFFPQYRLLHLSPTPEATLERARSIARAEGLDHVYIGNVLVKDSQRTVCPKCARTLVERVGYSVTKNDVREGACPHCGTAIYGVWQ